MYGIDAIIEKKKIQETCLKTALELRKAEA